MCFVDVFNFESALDIPSIYGIIIEVELMILPTNYLTSEQVRLLWCKRFVLLIPSIMVKYCCALGCKNEWKPNKPIRFHRFPLKRPEMSNKWVCAICPEGFTPTVHSVVCSDHFTKQSYLESSLNGNLLRKDAVPSLANLAIKNEFQENNGIDTSDLDPLRIEQASHFEIQEPTVNTQTGVFPTSYMSDSLCLKQSASNREIVVVRGEPSTSLQIDVGVETESRYFRQTAEELEKSRTIKMLRLKLGRRDKKIRAMEDLIRKLKNKIKSSTESEDDLIDGPDADV